MKKKKFPRQIPQFTKSLTKQSMTTQNMTPYNLVETYPLQDQEILNFYIHTQENLETKTSTINTRFVQFIQLPYSPFEPTRFRLVVMQFAATSDIPPGASTTLLR